MKLVNLFEMAPKDIDLKRISLENKTLYLLIKDIQKNGIQQPVVIKNKEIVDGIHTMFALWFLGYKGEVPIKDFSPNEKSK
jgi:hypothetical protein